jgi:hypothetical protein
VNAYAPGAITTSMSKYKVRVEGFDNTGSILVDSLDEKYSKLTGGADGDFRKIVSR